MVRALRYIAVEGPIGAGKTTLVKMLARDFKGEMILEPIEKNPFLKEFYKDRKRNAFKTQLYFLLTRYQQQLELIDRQEKNRTLLCDYTFAKDAIFAKINLSQEEEALYKTIYNLLEKKISFPDIVVYLRADADTLLSRIKKRAVDYERRITKEYLCQLTESYDKFFLEFSETPLLVVDTTKANYVRNPLDYENLKREITGHRGGTVHFIAR